MLRLMVLCLLPVGATAGQLAPERAAEIVARGEVVSSAPITTGGAKGNAVTWTPENTRMHEAFIRDGETVYLCFLTGRAMDGAMVRVECYD